MDRVEVKPVAEQIADLEACIKRNLDAMEDRQRRIDEGLTDMDDCFMSQRCEETTIQEARMKIELLKGDGMSDFRAYFDQEGNELDFQRIPDKYNRYGSVLVFRKPGQKPIYQSTSVKNLEACLAKKGITLGTVRRAAWVKLFSGGSGMYGAYMARPGIYEAAYNRVTGEKNPHLKFED